MDACSLRSNPTVSEHYSSSILLLCVGLQVAGWFREPAVLQAPVVPPSRAGQGPVLGPIAGTGQGPILGPMARDGQGPVLGPMARDGQGPILGPMASNIAPHRHSPTLTGALRRSSTPLRLQRSLCVPHLSCMQAHIEHEHVPRALRIDIHHCTLLCAHAQTSKRGGWPI